HVAHVLVEVLAGVDEPRRDRTPLQFARDGRDLHEIRPRPRDQSDQRWWAMALGADGRHAPRILALLRRILPSSPAPVDRKWVTLASVPMTAFHRLRAGRTRREYDIIFDFSASPVGGGLKRLLAY